MTEPVELDEVIMLLLLLLLLPPWKRPKAAAVAVDAAELINVGIGQVWQKREGRELTVLCVKDYQG